MSLILASAPVKAHEPLVFSRPEKASPEQGILGDLVLKEAYSRLGVEFVYRELPIERALRMADYGNTDGDFLRIAGLADTYSNLVMVQFPIQYMEVVVYSKKHHISVNGWDSLADYSIGLVRGFKLAEANTQGMHVETVTTVEQAFHKLNLGRNDVVVDLKSAQCKLKRLDLNGVHMLKPPLERIPLYHYLNIRHKQLALKLEQVLHEMERSGAVAKLTQKAQLLFDKKCAIDSK